MCFVQTKFVYKEVYLNQHQRNRQGYSAGVLCRGTFVLNTFHCTHKRLRRVLDRSVIGELMLRICSSFCKLKWKFILGFCVLSGLNMPAGVAGRFIQLSGWFPNCQKWWGDIGFYLMSRPEVQGLSGVIGNSILNFDFSCHPVLNLVNGLKYV